MELIDHRVVMKLNFEMEDVPLAQLRDDGLSANECYPKELVDDPTFALLDTDNYFVRHGPRAHDWSQPPSAQLINGRSPPYGKRGLEFPREQFAWDDGNSSRPFTGDEADAIADLLWWEEEEEAKKHDAFGYVPCLGNDCATEITPIARYVSPLYHLHQFPVIIAQ